jgi:hypothetical protein
MSVYVTDYSIIPWEVVHDEMGHTGTIDPATIVHPKNMDGAENHDFLIVTCPVCQAVSTHPVGGGAQKESVQQMFVRKEVSLGVPPAEAIADVKARVVASDGEGRWALDDASLLRKLSA